ncbi:hypothetical protein [Simplicispira lacusdiani]|uniref:hypothetical protein n=1 Tax=Simplicispira lacusdiani TaxID=2213010 RepID=UPI000E7087A4|nr:hypothetical protein [Simplicispira lacusdiani]
MEQVVAAMKPALVPVASVVLACTLVVPAWASVSTAAASLQSAEAVAGWPRLFFSAEQRKAIERARLPVESAAPAEPGAAAMPTATPFVLQGLAQGRRGASAWINGEMLQQGDMLAGRTVVIEPLAVRLRLAGQPDIVLRPGQQSQEGGAPVQDLVPTDAFRKK